MEYKKLFEESETEEILNYLLNKNFEYHKPYMRFGKMAKVPRGQASYTIDNSIHYNYKVSGGSPPNEVMDDKLKAITKKVNEELKTNYNTILMNVYKDGKDCIGQHKDKEDGWEKNTGFATLAFGAIRNFDIINNETQILTRIPHKAGYVINMPYPLNHHNTHGIPPQPRVKTERVSLTFREIIPNSGLV